MAYKIMIMGASYGSLLASKVLFGGHSVHLICLPAEADLINPRASACACRSAAARTRSRSIRASCRAR